MCNGYRIFLLFIVFFFKQKTAYEMRISDWSSDVCSSDLLSWRPVGTQHLKLELGLPGVRLQAIEFGGWTGTPPASRVRVAYRLSPDDYRGGDAIQLVVVHRESLD